MTKRPRWLTAAAKDLKSARLLAGEEPTGSVFHSQQAAEKSAKAFLAFHNVPFRRTHDLEELGKQCVEVEPSLDNAVAEAKDLSDYAVVFRYLDAPHEPDTVEGTTALEIAGRPGPRRRVIGSNPPYRPLNPYDPE